MLRASAHRECWVRVNPPHEYEVNLLFLASASEVFLSLVMPTPFSIACCARYPIDEIQCDITAASLGTRSWPSQTEREDFWPEYGPSQDFSNISSLQDNFSDVASEDMRRPLPDFEEEIDIEEGLGQPSGDEDLPQEPEQIGPEFDESFKSHR